MLRTSRGSFSDLRAHARVKRCISISDIRNEIAKAKQPQNKNNNTPYYSFVPGSTLTSTSQLNHPLIDKEAICNVDEDEDDDESDSFCSSSTLLESPSPSSSLVYEDECLLGSCDSSHNSYTYNEYSSASPASSAESVDARISPALPHSLMCFTPSTPSVATVSLVSSSPEQRHKSLSKAKSTDCLNKMLNRSRLAPNLSSFFTNLKNQVNVAVNRYLPSVNPRSTDDKSVVVTYNQHARCSGGSTFKTNSSPVFQEMATFSVNTKEEVDLGAEVTRVQFKQRDLRINSQFLRLYAHDYNLRCLGLMYFSDSDEEDYNDFAGTDYDIDYVNDLSNKSREKLWRNVILPPRSDNHPEEAIDGSCYVFVGGMNEEHGNKMTASANSLIRLKLNYLPWGPSNRSLKPAGDLRSGKVLTNGQSPNSGVTREQFTIKGWCNPRWLPQASEEED